jgi:hypothetical protein
MTEWDFYYAYVSTLSRTDFMIARVIWEKAKAAENLLSNGIYCGTDNTTFLYNDESLSTQNRMFWASRIREIV